MDLRIGTGYDVHRLAPGLKLMLGGIEVPHTAGEVAHSDGDVLIHALCDALLGAVALGDIGKFFLDTDPAYKGIDSKILLQKSYDLVREQGYTLINADITLALQRPKVAPYIMLMRECLSSLLSVEVSAISIKATTTEGLGFEGRQEGISAYATVLLMRENSHLNG